MNDQTKRDSLPILKDRVSLSPELMTACLICKTPMPKEDKRALEAKRWFFMRASLRNEPTIDIAFCPKHDAEDRGIALVRLLR